MNVRFAVFKVCELVYLRSVRSEVLLIVNWIEVDGEDVCDANPAGKTPTLLLVRLAPDAVGDAPRLQRGGVPRMCQLRRS